MFVSFARLRHNSRIAAVASSPALLDRGTFFARVAGPCPSHYGPQVPEDADDLRSLVDHALDEMLRTPSQVSSSRIGRVFRLSRAAVQVTAGLTGRKLRSVIAGEASDPGAMVREVGSKTAEKLMRTLGQMKGAAMKAGQMLSYVDDTLPPEYRKYLALLQTHSQPAPIEEIRVTINQELGVAAVPLLETLEPTPIACASIGQVHRARLPDGTEVAVKVQYDGIEAAMRADLSNAKLAGTLVQAMFPHSDAKGDTAEIMARLLEECDYRREAEWQRRFVQIFSDHPAIIVPEVHDEWCARRVLTTTYSGGLSFRDFLASHPSQAKRDTVAAAMVRFYIGSLYLNGLFNCDPHPGNYLFEPDGRVVFLDYGCVKAFEPEYVEQLAALAHAVVEDDEVLIHAACIDLKIVDAKTKYDRAAARELLRYLYAPILEDRVFRLTSEYNSQFLRKMILKNKNLFKLSLPGEMVFLNRINFGLFSVMAELGADVNWAEMGRQFRLGRDPTLAELDW